MSLLLTGISPRAVRTSFDFEFGPSCLGASLKKESNKLLDLKKNHRINQSQWNLLFPKSPDVPESKTFDVSLMVTLLRNLTNLTPPRGGFDCLPAAKETSAGADLARIKYYRNYLAHLDEGKVDTTYFGAAWTDLTGAIGRLAGQQMKQECDNLKTKILDQTNQEIILDIKRSNDEMREMKESFKSLKLSHTEMKESHKLLQKDHAHVTKEMEELKNSQKDTVPWNIRDGIRKTLKDWKDDDKMFIDTRAAKLILKCIKENSCVTIIASSGVGKTATLQHVALQMAAEYDVLLVTDPSNIVNYYNPNKKILFVLDDLCGNFSVDQSDIKSWDTVMENIKKNLDKKQTKILAACRLQVYQDEKFESLSIFKSCVCNLLSEDICLTKTEKHSIADLYLKGKASEVIGYCNLYDCFPLLCKLYNDNPKLNITNFFKNPFSVYEAEVDNLQKKGDHTKYCALALCVMFNNNLKLELFTKEVNEENRTIIENTYEACRLDRGTSRLVLQDGLKSLKGTFIKQERHMYKILHDKVFDFLVYYFGQKIILFLMKNADIGLIKERFVFERKDHVDQFITILPSKYHGMYIQRMVDDWSKGKVQDVFTNINIKVPQFRQKFLFHLRKLDISFQRQLAHICGKHKPFKISFNFNFCSNKTLSGDFDKQNDDYDDDEDSAYDTALLQCCYIGDIPLVLWCCNHGVDVNMCTYSGLSPLMIACKHGHTEIVKMLLDRKVDCNKCDSSGQSSVMKACEHGHTRILMMLVDKGADLNRCDSVGQSPLAKACKHGHIGIVKMLVDKGADYNTYDSFGQSPVMKACQHGHAEIVKMLLDKGADYDKCDNDGESPLMKACKHGQSEIVKMLLDRGANYNKCDWMSKSHELKIMLANRGADCNVSVRLNQSSLMYACWYGHTEIVQMLLDRGADCNTRDTEGQSPVMMDCEQGHKEIVKLLLDGGADYTYDRFGELPIIIACNHGHTEIVNMLLDRQPDC